MSHQPYPQQPGWGPPQQPGWGTPPPPKKTPVAKILGIGCAGIFGLFIFIGIITTLTSSDDSDSGKSDTADNTAKTVEDDDGGDKPLDEAAAVMCEEFVKQRLKSPGSAEFPGVWDADYAKTKVLSDTKPWKYKVAGVVDSQNSFGAKVRTNYVCTVSTKDNDSWTLDDLDLTER